MDLQRAQEQLEWARRELATLEKAERDGRLSSFDGGEGGRTGKSGRLKLNSALRRVQQLERILRQAQARERVAA